MIRFFVKDSRLGGQADSSKAVGQRKKTCGGSAVLDVRGIGRVLKITLVGDTVVKFTKNKSHLACCIDFSCSSSATFLV
jgi:hypothetical protein